MIRAAEAARSRRDWMLRRWTWAQRAPYSNCRISVGSRLHALGE